MNVIITFLALLKQQRERPETSGFSRCCLSSARNATITFIHLLFNPSGLRLIQSRSSALQVWDAAN